MSLLTALSPVSLCGKDVVAAPHSFPTLPLQAWESLPVLIIRMNPRKLEGSSITTFSWLWCSLGLLGELVFFLMNVHQQPQGHRGR